MGDPSDLKSITYKALGLYTFPNQFGAPRGALSVATDIFIDRPGVIEAARVFTTSYNRGAGPTPSILGFLSNFSVGTDSTSTGIDFACQDGIMTTADFQSAGIAGVQATVTPKKAWYYSGTEIKLIDNAGSLTSFAYRILSSFTSGKFVYAACGGNFNIGTATSVTPPGPARTVYKMPIDGTTFTTQTRGAGIAEAPAPEGYWGGTTWTGLTGLFSPASGKSWGGNDPYTGTAAVNIDQRAYRVLFSYRDLSGRLVRGTPSGRHIVYAPGADFGLIVFGVDRLFVGDIIQVYASEISTAINPSTVDANATISEPSDDMRLVYEYVVQSADITAKVISFQDISPDITRGAALYTDDYEEGILQSEQAPPSAGMIQWFKNVAWYGGVWSRGHTDAVVNVLGLGPSGYTATTTTWTINSLVYTADTAEDVTTRKFQIFTSGSKAQNLFNTIKSLVRCINYADTSVIASFVSPPNATSATFILKYFGTGGGMPVTNPGTCTVATNASSGTVSPSGTITTKEPSKPGWLYYSKPNQPDAVPDVNYIAVGAPEVGISGLAHVRDSLFVFKPEGLFRVTGTTAANINVELFDETVHSWPSQYRSISEGGNQIFAVCNQGIVSITESGVSVVSRAIEDQLYGIISNPMSYDPFTHYSAILGCASETERKYFLYYKYFVSTSAARGGYSSGMYSYNFATQAWASKTPPANQLSWMFSIENTGSPDIIFMTDGQTLPFGYAMFPVGAVQTGYAAAPTFRYAFYDDQNPSELKRFYDVMVVTFGSGSFTSISAQFSSDSGSSPVTVTVVPSNSYVARIEVPKEHALCSSLQVLISSNTGTNASSTGGNLFKVSQVQLRYENAGDWVTRA